MKERLFQDLLLTIKEMDLFDIYVICGECERDLPNKKYITENGCYWCDPKGE